MVTIMIHIIEMGQLQVDDNDKYHKFNDFGDLRLIFQQYLLLFSWIQIDLMSSCIHLTSNEILNKNSYVRLSVLSLYNKLGLLASTYSSEMRPK